MVNGVYTTASGRYQVVLVRAWVKGKPSTRKYFGTFESKTEAQALARDLKARYPTEVTKRKRKLYNLLKSPMGGVKNIPISTHTTGSSTITPIPVASPPSPKRKCQGDKAPRGYTSTATASEDRDDSSSSTSGED